MKEAELLVLYATTMGNAEDCAEKTVRRAIEMGLSARLWNMGDGLPEGMAEETKILLVASTWGDGDPPDDAVPFYEKIQEMDTGSMTGSVFAVFGLGDRAYDDFCGFARKMDKEFERLGSTRLMSRREADVEYEDELEAWLRDVLPVIREARPASAF